jgi:hypothetical protein
LVSSRREFFVEPDPDPGVGVGAGYLFGVQLSTFRKDEVHSKMRAIYLKFNGGHGSRVVAVAIIIYFVTY